MRQKFFNLRVKLLEHDMTQEEAAKIAGHQPQRDGEPHERPLSVRCVGDAAARKGT